MLQDNLFCLCMFKLIFLNDFVFENRFHGEHFFIVFLLYQEHSAKSSFSKHSFRSKILKGDFFLNVVSKKCFGRFSDNLFFLLFMI